MKPSPRIQAAVERAVAYLADAQLSDGEFPSRVCAEPSLRRRCAPDTNFFTTSQVLWSLGFMRGRRVPFMIRRAARFLTDGMEPDGSWRFFTPKVQRRIDPDVDVTACAAAAIRDRADNTSPDSDCTRTTLLAARDAEGRFLTWIRAESHNDLDSVANANVLWLLGDDPGAQGAVDWLEELLDSSDVTESYPYYESPLALHHATTRAFFAGARCLASLRERLIGAVLAARQADGRFGNVLETAMAVCCLHNLGESAHPAVLPAQVCLMRHQRRDGSWPALAAWNGPEWPAPRSLWWGGECWTTALAAEALARGDLTPAEPRRSAG